LQAATAYLVIILSKVTSCFNISGNSQSLAAGCLLRGVAAGLIVTLAVDAGYVVLLHVSIIRSWFILSSQQALLYSQSGASGGSSELTTSAASLFPKLS